MENNFRPRALFFAKNNQTYYWYSIRNTRFYVYVTMNTSHTIRDTFWLVTPVSFLISGSQSVTSSLKYFISYSHLLSSDYYANPNDQPSLIYSVTVTSNINDNCYHLQNMFINYYFTLWSRLIRSFYPVADGCSFVPLFCPHSTTHTIFTQFFLCVLVSVWI